MARQTKTHCVILALLSQVAGDHWLLTETKSNRPTPYFHIPPLSWHSN